jgi:hypothetical protein
MLELVDQQTLLVWLFATTGWLGDWLSTVWPGGQFVEQNPLVVRWFGERPDPLAFGLAKVGSLAVFVLLYAALDALIRGDDAIPDVLFGLDTALLLPAFVGVLGWVATVHNCRVRWQNSP